MAIRNGRCRTLLMSGLAMLVASCAQTSVTTEAVAQESGKRFKDWTVGCEKLPDSDQERCFIYQTVVNNKDDKPVFQIAIGYMPGIKEPTALLTVPLGVTLPAGVQIKIDENERVFRVGYERCIPRGCIAGMKLNDEMLNMFRKGNKANVLVYNGDQAVQLPISLSGFTAGFNSLR